MNKKLTQKNITTEKLLDQLAFLKHIAPRDSFSEQSKRLICALPKTTPAYAPTTETVSWGTRIQTLAFRTVRVGSFVGAGVVIILIAFYATQELSPVLLPGLNQQRISAEADMINSTMNIELSRIGYFEQTSKESASLLQQMSQKNMDHLNTTIITREAEAFATSTSETLSDTNAQLNTLIQKITE